MKNRTLEVYKNSVLNNFSFLKSSENIQDLYLRAIPVKNIGFLIPLGKSYLESNPYYFNLSTLEKLYFSNVQKIGDTKLPDVLSFIEKTDNILFAFVANSGQHLCYLGFYDCHNDNQNFSIFSFMDLATKEFNSIALTSLIEWARKTINVSDFILNKNQLSEISIKQLTNDGFIEVDNVRLLWRQTSNSPGKEMILTAGPSISAKESVFAFDAATNGWNSNWSKYLTAFEKSFAQYIGVKYALATSSCTGALHIALMALGIGQGDEVIVPDETWVATANAVRYVGAIPIFADIELDTWNIEANSIESLITANTKAIIAVHMYGHPARMTEITKLAKKYNLYLVEDAAPAIGAEWEGKRCGTFGDFAAFSFQGAKLMVTGEGGMLVTNDDRLYEKALKIWDQGRNPSRVFWIDDDGVKYKMSNVQAAVGLAQLERVDELIEMKRRIFSWYEEGLSDLENIKLNHEVVGARSIYWMSSLILNDGAPITRDNLIQRLKERKIDSRPVFPAISQYPIWPKHQTPRPNALKVGLNALNLPSGVCLTRDQVSYVSKSIQSILKGE